MAEHRATPGVPRPSSVPAAPADVEQQPAVPDPGSLPRGAVITPYRDGPLIVRGTFTITDPDGVEIDPGRATVALCRCGKSAVKPFCDGSHVRAGFRAASAPSRPRPTGSLRDEAAEQR